MSKSPDRWRRRVTVTALAALILSIVVLGGAVLLGFRIQDQARQEGRDRDCHALDDVGNAIKAGVGVLTRPAQPQTDEQRARLNEFIAEYSKAVDAEIAKAKLKKGYAPDCSHV